MELPLESQKQIQIAGYLHDIGKLYIPIHILEKKGRLTASEYSLMRIHSYKTDEMLSQIEPLRNIKHWAANHHERLDGSGYPGDWWHTNLIYRAKYWLSLMFLLLWQKTGPIVKE